MYSKAVVRGALVAAALILVAAPRPGVGQTAPPPAPPAFQATGVPDDARFAIVASASGLLLKLDKFTGEVERLVPRGGDAIAWQAVRRDRNPKDAAAGDHRTHYQLVVAGGRTVLLNIITGATWSLQAGEPGEEPFLKVFE